MSNPLPSTPNRRILLILLVLVIGLLLSAYLWRESILRRMGEYLVAPSPSVQADVGFVLGGGRSNRADFAAELFHAGKIHRILLSGAGGIADVDGVAILSEQEILDRMLRALNVPAESISRLQDHSKSTEEEITALGRYLVDHPNTTCAIITSNYHTRRCQLLAKHLLGANAHRVQITGAPSATFTPANWWKSEEGVAAGFLEWTKLVTTWLRGWF